MNIEYTRELRGPLEALLREASRINTMKPQKYWYPLSVATYDVEEILGAVDSLCSFRTTMWEKTAQFEQVFATYVNAKESVMVNSGSSADLLIAFALVNPSVKMLAQGDEVLVPSITWPTQLWSLMMAGLRIRLVDVDVRTLNVSIEDLEQKISSRTRAISLVHLMGNPCDMDSILRICRTRNLVLIEDCCESLGATYGGQPVGTFGVAGSFSFFFSHHITTMEGGMIACNDAALSDVFRLLRAHGWARNTKHMPIRPHDGIDPRYTFINWGFNVRPTEIQAAFGLEQMKRLPAFREARAANVARFAEYLESRSGLMTLMSEQAGGECAWFALPIMLTETCPFSKDELLRHLEEEGVETRPVVAGNLALQPVCELFPELRDEAILPGAMAVHDRGFYIGIHPFVTPGTMDRLCEVFEKLVRRYH